VLAYALAQVAGGIAGAVLANVMFEVPVTELVTTDRTGAHMWVGEVVATAGLVALIFALARTGRGLLAAPAVGAYIGAAYWFTSSTSFANPAVTIGRVFSDTFAGIAPGRCPGSYSPSSSVPPSPWVWSATSTHTSAMMSPTMSSSPTTRPKLVEGTPVVAGLVDGAAAGLEAGVLSHGDVCEMTGQSTVVNAAVVASAARASSGALSVMPYVVPGHRLVFGSMVGHRRHPALVPRRVRSCGGHGRRRVRRPWTHWPIRPRRAACAWWPSGSGQPPA
jgi:hypothetical protein